MDRKQQLQAIAAEIAACPLCKQGGTGKPVPGEGTGEAGIMFIGEAPGRTEAQTGKPFVGRSGRFLRALIAESGLEAEHVFFTSPVHYLPLRGKPSPAMIDHGRVHLLKQIETIKPRVVVLLGCVAGRALLDRNPELAKEHGTVIEKEGMNFLVTFHPAYAVRFPDGRKKFLEDFAKIVPLLKNRAAGKPRKLLKSA